MTPKSTPSDPTAPTATANLSQIEFRPDQLRQALYQGMVSLRQQTLELIEGLAPEVLCCQVHPDFSPIGWHLGHIGFTEERWILQQLANHAPEQLTLQTPTHCRLFAADGLSKAERQSLPSLAELCAALEQIRSCVFAYLEVAPIEQQAELWYWLLQHEAQHSETIAILRQLQQHTLPQFGSAPKLSPEAIAPAATELVWVPAGEFQQGNEQVFALDNEKAPHPVELPAYWIDRYPVTRGQFRQFMVAGGYRQRQWWSAAGWAWLQDHPVSQPLYWYSPVGDDHPVCGVSYYEAEAYANFVGKRLPTEAEWEKVARWQPDANSSRTYPWGEQLPSAQRCNHGQQVGQTTPVNHYPQGQSAYGCCDLLGNVWEWTASWFHPYPGFASFPYPGYSAVYFDEAHRVLRGGSWATQAPALRASFRNWYNPGTREIFAGFRCASDTPPPGGRLTLVNLLAQPTDRVVVESGADVIQGLSQTPKTLPPKYFYDDYGSQLFEQICTLPEYYPTRTEAWILQTYAGEIAQLTGTCELVELGSGSATKTRLLLDAYAELGASSPDPSLRYLPIDVSGGILTASAQDLLYTYPPLQVHGLVATYELGLAHLPPRLDPSRMIVFLGSTLGNFNPEECQAFLAQIRAALQPGEFFLLGVDLQKPVAILEAAYNDAQGVTAEFNLNMLRHLNRRFDGNFALEQFRHRAIYNPCQHQIEMYLDSQVAQQVKLTQLGLSVEFQAGEAMLTEISRKFSLPTLEQELTAHQLQPRHTWTDPQTWFGLVLCQKMRG